MMGLKNSFLILITLIVLNAKVSHAQEYSAYDLLKSCNNYKNWIEKNFESPVDQQALFNMGNVKVY